MLSTLFMVGLIGCAVAIPATVIMSIVKKKAGIPLALFGLFTLLVLGAGFAAPGNNPFPAQEPVSQYTRSELHGFQPYEDIRATVQPIEPDAPAEEELSIEPQDDPEASEALEPVEESEPSPAASTPSKSSGSKSTSKATPAANSSDYDSAPVPEPAVSADPLSSIGPMLEEETAPTSDNGPVLAGDPAIAPMANPTLTDDLEPNYSAGPTLSGNNGTSSSGNLSSENYSHDFSGGRLLGTVMSNKYHCGDCVAARKIPPENEVWFDSVEDAVAQGYGPCGICYK